MNQRPIKDVASSIRQRLCNNAKQNARPFQEVLQYFAMERFLYRLSQSPHADKFVLKGGLMFTAWQAPSSRPTKDIDLLARVRNHVDSILALVRDICMTSVDPDGLVFDSASLQGMIIKEDADYEGIRVTFTARLQNAQVHMQLDMGFGDVLTPPASFAEYPTILDHASAKLWGYSRETSIAEKFEAMVKLGQLNSRMKDFFDIWLLARQFNFDGELLAAAIAKTFSHRSTVIEVRPTALTSAFASDPAKIAQWRGFLRKSRITVAPTELNQVIETLAGFLMPVARAIQDGRPCRDRWVAPGPWQPSEG